MTLLDEIQARLDAATPGPWEIYADDDDVIGQVVCQMWPKPWKVMRSNAIKPFADTPDEYANADLIAHAPTDLAALLGIVHDALWFLNWSLEGTSDEDLRGQVDAFLAKLTP